MHNFLLMEVEWEESSAPLTGSPRNADMASSTSSGITESPPDTLHYDKKKFKIISSVYWKHLGIADFLHQVFGFLALLLGPYISYLFQPLGDAHSQHLDLVLFRPCYHLRFHTSLFPQPLYVFEGTEIPYSLVVHD